MNTKTIFYSALTSCFILSNCWACTPKAVDFDPSIVNSSPDLIALIKADNNWLGFSNVGDTVIKVKPEKEVLPEKPSQLPDLGKIQKVLGKTRLVAVGGGLSAGFRDGGLYREGQLTAFPNLVARQMGIGFVQPLFSEAEGNGTGYKTVAKTEPLVSYNMVSNNLGVSKNGAETAYSKFAGGSAIDQMAFPEITKGLGYYNLQDPRINSHKYVDRVFSAADREKYQKPSDWVEAQTADLFIFELGFDDTYRCVSSGGGGISAGPLAGYVMTASEFLWMKTLVVKKMNGVLLNVPHVLDFPYFQQITTEKVNKLGVKLFVQTSYGSDQFRPYDPSIDRLVPTATTEKLLKGELKGVVRLTDQDVISQADGDFEINMVSPVDYNTFEVEREAKKLGWPVVDVYKLYQRILAGGYISNDGVPVLAAWPRGGNFFSADGIYPTAFGQAVIANEVIKTINQHYGLAIPLLQTRLFLKRTTL